ncbi:MAG: hypothetical protein JWQ25_154 [Daejeonella sp.]|nr:hypothetical protein [Daejeonella sp.]
MFKLVSSKLILSLLILSALSCKKEDPNLPQIDLNVKANTTVSAYVQPSNSFALGVKGYPFTYTAYRKIPLAKQLDLIGKMGVKIYSVDLTLDANFKTNETLLNELNTVSKQKNVKLLPVIPLKGLNYLSDSTTAYNSGRALGTNIALSYGSIFEFYQLGNLQENAFIIAGKHGNSTADYSYAKFKILASYLKGMNEGIKATDADAKTIVNATWLHFSYLQMLLAEKVNFDVIGYDWYSNMDDNAKSNFGISDISQKLSSVFSKPIWFTKLNIWQGTANKTQDEQRVWLNGFITKCKNNPLVGAVIINELLDQPEMASTEKQYGIVSVDATYTTVVNKTFGTELVQKSEFFFGINGHPTTKAYLGTTAKQQFDMLRNMGMNYYRLDFMTGGDGNISGVSSIMNPFFTQGNLGDVRILPCIYTRFLDFNMTTENAYNTGKAIAGGFAARYGQNFEYYELGNELDNKTIIYGKNGNIASEYDAAKMDIVAAYLKGMIAGVNENDPTAKTIINGGWIHFGYLQALQARNVNYDIIGWHWYSDMESVAANSVAKVTNIGESLNTMFNKPVWFTEINQKNGTTTKTEEEQKLWLNTFVTKCRNTPNVKGALVYELFDEPEHGDPVERKYGLAKWRSVYSDWEYKTAATSFAASK